MLFAVDLHEHLIQKVGITESRMPASETSGEFRAKFVDPEPNGLVADGYITLSEKVLDISDAEIEPIVKPNGMLNDRRRESMLFIDVVHRDMLPEGHLICQYPGYGSAKRDMELPAPKVRTQRSKNHLDTTD